MTTIVTMPDVAETVVEGTIARWLKQEGERVAEYEPLVEVVTDKVVVEVPSPANGVLSKILAAPNTTVKIGAELARIEEEAPVGSGVAAGMAATAGHAVREGGPSVQAETGSRRAGSHNGETRGHDGETRDMVLSPLVRRLAEEHGVDVTAITGTGIGGRVRKQDILDFVARRQAAPGAPPFQGAKPSLGPGAPARTEAPAPARAARPDGNTEIPLAPVRAMIARRMVQSKQEVPHAWTTFLVDVTGLVALRESAKERFLQSEEFTLTYLPFFIKAAVESLKEHPALNAHWGGDRIILKKDVNIGVAVDRDEGLIVVTLRNADQKSIAGLARGLRDLIEKARADKLAVSDVRDATFTLNNTGTFGSIMSMPILVQPQAAILATEAIVKQPVVVGDNAIAIRSVMHISISFDHRMLDGGQVGRFMQEVKRRLEGYGPGMPIY